MSEGQHLITLQQIRDRSPCEKGWEALLRGLGTRDMNTEVTVADVAMINSTERGVPLAVRDALWCLRCIKSPRLRVWAILPAVMRALVHTQDQRVHEAVADLERWLSGDDSTDLEAAQKKAEAAVLSAPAPASAPARAALAVARAARAATTIWPEESTAWAAWAAWAAVAARENARLTEYQAQLDDLVALFGLYAAKKKKKL